MLFPNEIYTLTTRITVYGTLDSQKFYNFIFIPHQFPKGRQSWSTDHPPLDLHYQVQPYDTRQKFLPAVFFLPES